MAEFNPKEFEEVLGYSVDFDYIDSTDVMTGDYNKAVQLYYQLIASMNKAKSIDIVVSFLMESGVKMLLKDLKRALDDGAKVRILTGNYLGITQPSALYLIKHELGDRVDLRFYNDKSRSFHPKSYIFHYATHSDIYIGSSNISRSALTSGIEWNYKFSSEKDPVNYGKFYKTFEDLFNNHSMIIDDTELKKYSKNWHRPAATKDLEKYDDDDKKETIVESIFEPRGAQIEAICSLENTRAEGAKKALVHAATGVGKTYLAAFDSKTYERVLFVAHRQEILSQAARSFYNVRKEEDYGFFDGDNKCTDKNVIFASVATLGQEKYLNPEFFSKDYFQYIVIDEFHHAVNEQYLRIVNYFEPEFLLGLTATPERMDGRSIYEICDYNVPYEISLREAINKGILVPFHYYGIYDDTDYSKLHVVRGRYDEKELNETYIGNVHRHDLIYKNYRKYGSKRALGFCCSRAHAEEMAKEFVARGVSAVAVYSNAHGEFSEDREVAIEKLKSGEIQVIFSVDMFNEGVDIVDLDMVMFLRPTESPIVFLQQLGRGLRKANGKRYLNVLDFIGNYEKAGRVRFFINENNTNQEGNSLPGEIDLPDDCLVDFDLRLIDLFEEMDKKQSKLDDRILSEFYRIKGELGHRPSRMEFFTYIDDVVFEKIIHSSQSKKNIFKNYLGFLEENNELTLSEIKFCKTIGREFIGIIEKTDMTRVYKMPVLSAFLNNGDCRMQVNESQLLCCWKEFFSKGKNWKDLPHIESYEQYKNMTDSAHKKNIFKNPVRYLVKSGEGFFSVDEDRIVSLRPEMANIIDNPVFKEQFRDVIEYRTMYYYRNRLHMNE